MRVVFMNFLVFQSFKIARLAKNDNFENEDFVCRKFKGKLIKNKLEID